MFLRSTKTNVENSVFPISGPLGNHTENTSIFKNSEKRTSEIFINDELPRLLKCKKNKKKKVRLSLLLQNT